MRRRGTWSLQRTWGGAGEGGGTKRETERGDHAVARDAGVAPTRCRRDAEGGPRGTSEGADADERTGEPSDRHAASLRRVSAVSEPRRPRSRDVPRRDHRRAERAPAHGSTDALPRISPAS